jgi:hypothetical protein
MSKNNSVISNDNSDLDAVIREVKEELKTIFFRRKDLITKLGEAFKHTVSDEESICEEIKNALRDEIRDGHISERDIERYCPDEWKQKTKPKKPKNDKLSFPRHEQEAIPQMLVGANGKTVVEPASDSGNDSVNNEGFGNEQAKYTVGSNAGNEPGDAITKSDIADQQQQLLSEQDREKKLEPKNEAIMPDLQPKSEIHILDNQEDKCLDLQFEVPFETLREHMASSLRIHAKSIWFFVKFHLVSKSVSDVRMG